MAAFKTKLTASLFAGLALLSAGPSNALELHREYNRAWDHWLARDQDANKILLGKEVPPGSHLWQVPILRADISDNYYSLFCSGSYIAERWILTAAHCVDGLKSSDINALADSMLLDGSGRRVSVDTIVTNPKYDEESMIGDLALLRVTDILNKPIIEVANRANEELGPGSKVFVSGWGVTDTATDRKSINLREINVPYQTNKVCNLPESYNHLVKPSMFCAGNMSGGEDACTYDSGGPATVVITGPPILVGIVSFGQECGQPKKFGVYTRVAPYRSWIMKSIRLSNESLNLLRRGSVFIRSQSGGSGAFN